MLIQLVFRLLVLIEFCVWFLNVPHFTTSQENKFEKKMTSSNIPQEAKIITFLVELLIHRLLFSHEKV
jgi:hypothetical protein